MPQYIIVCLGGNQPSSPEEGNRNFARYMDWLLSLGESAVSPANPLKGTMTINPGSSISSGSKTSMSGYTIIEAESMDAALTAAKSCPFLEVGGSLEVSEMVKMPG